MTKNFIKNSSAVPPDLNLVAELLLEALQSGESPSLMVISNSMAPLLEKNDQVILEPVDLETLKKGDIITIKSNEGFLTHRVVSRSNREIRTKGDRNITLDPPHHIDQIIGRVASIKSIRLKKTINLNRGWHQIVGKLIYRASIIEFFIITRVKQRNPYRLIPVTFHAVMRLLTNTM
ncbi:MAG: signal peptidase I [Anaerolineae bacterium]